MTIWATSYIGMSRCVRHHLSPKSPPAPSKANFEGQSGGTDVEVPDENPFIEVSAYHRSARFDDRASVEPYRLLEGATLGKPGGLAPSGSA
jgi:hypothetical protein